MYDRIFLKKYQKNTEKREPFNEKLINYRQHEDLYNLVSDIGKGLEIIDGVKFLGCSVEKNTSIYKQGPKKKRTESGKYEDRPKEDVHIERSRFIIIKMKFELFYKEERSIKDLILYYPELIDGQYFLINGNKYCPVLQLVDAECYSTSNTITLKTSLMPIVLRSEKAILKDVQGRLDIKTKSINLDLFKNKVNVFHYYFAKMGIEKTIEFFHLSKGDESYFSIDEEPIDTDPLNECDCYSFKLSKSIYLNVWKEWFDKDPKQNALFVMTFINAFKGRTSYDKLFDQEYWKRKLGSNFTKNNSNFMEKCKSILSSLERLLDETTIRNLRIKDVDKTDIYAVIRWMMINYTTLFNIDNMDLANKRMRINEYLLYPLISKFSSAIYRLINSKNINLNKLKTMFSTIGKDFLIKNIIKSDLLRYNNNVNTFNLFQNLKGTISGRIVCHAIM